MVAKLLVPSVRCPACGHANDADFLFCQRCAYQRKRLTQQPAVLLDVDLITLYARLRQLTNFEKSTSYARQKDCLQNELKSFLTALPGSPTLSTVTPRDLCRFLVYKDTCPFLGQRGTHTYECQMRLSFKPVDSYCGLFFIASAGMVSGTHACV